jgi:hypothetical protein
MRFNRISLADKRIFDKYLSLSGHELSAYAFANIYIWRRLFDINWGMVEDSLCIFFQDKIGTFLYLDPLGRNRSPQLIEKIFQTLDKFNKNKDISRIENIEEKDKVFYDNLGYERSEKSQDYLCLTKDLTDLKGDKFKSKRSAFNYFIKHYDFKYLPFSLKYEDECRKLYNCWMNQRKAANKDNIYRGMLKDSRETLMEVLNSYSRLGIIGRVVKIDGMVKAFTFGFKLNLDTFCILYEITDLSIKGLAQFIFRQFCRELRDYKYINIMDDSGLENLRKVKLSYHPARLIPAYIAKRK